MVANRKVCPHLKKCYIFLREGVQKLKFNVKIITFRITIDRSSFFIYDNTIKISPAIFMITMDTLCLIVIMNSSASFISRQRWPVCAQMQISLLSLYVRLRDSRIQQEYVLQIIGAPFSLGCQVCIDVIEDSNLSKW